MIRALSAFCLSALTAFVLTVPSAHALNQADRAKAEKKKAELVALLRETFAGTKHEAAIEKIVQRFDAGIEYFAERGIFPDAVHVGGAVALGAGLGVEGGILVGLEPLEGEKVNLTVSRFFGGNLDAGVEALDDLFDRGLVLGSGKGFAQESDQLGLLLLSLGPVGLVEGVGRGDRQDKCCQGGKAKSA
jgi:hypothetical protein